MNFRLETMETTYNVKSKTYLHQKCEKMVIFYQPRTYQLIEGTCND